eukprot:CAMPEP_0204264648 /NCGR_PEP_ID=MMETSP0468-20130131/9150_1 /ASSEMBLY_ACC=CAM_ASM_000383 /TAXON_ID=2969 /ORGANISM="Oxyrrhis marina" /LENGTH=96 /DNA_ID=CAMNT_0051239529 /DNA_START=552 /DNA_END=842 /DNA_ORIENTATION=+
MAASSRSRPSARSALALNTANSSRAHRSSSTSLVSTSTSVRGTICSILIFISTTTRSSKFFSSIRCSTSSSAIEDANELVERGELAAMATKVCGSN